MKADMGKEWLHKLERVRQNKEALRGLHDFKMLNNYVTSNQLMQKQMKKRLKLKMEDDQSRMDRRAEKLNIVYTH